MTSARKYSVATILVLAITGLTLSCDHGFEPPPELGAGRIVVDLSYEGRIPPSDSLNDLRFVAMRFLPRDTADFLMLNEIEFSTSIKPVWLNDTLRFFEQIILDPVQEGDYVYNGVAQQFSESFFDWQPVGLVLEGDGMFMVMKDQTTRVSVHVDFYNRPPFPPE